MYSEDGSWQNADAYNLALLPGLIALYGTGGVQNYAVDKLVSPASIKKIFPDFQTILKKSLFHTEGETDHAGFQASIKALAENKKISSFQYSWLQSFIADCDCPPAVIREKLCSKGYGYILPDIKYQTPKPLLLKLSRVMQMFVARISDGYDR
jgi:hypothetical protein